MKPLPRHRFPVLALATVLAGGLFGLFGLRIGWGIDLAALAVGLLIMVIGAVLIKVRWPWPDRQGFGWANTTTAVRLAGAGWLAALTVQAAGELSEPGWWLMILLGSLCLGLDGVDGRFARSRGEADAFGARFDMETDALMLILLSVAVGLSGSVGWWVLGLGGLRYLYLVASWIIPALQIPLPFHYSRKVIAVVQGIALLLCLLLDRLLTSGSDWPWLPSVVAAVSLGLLMWSFGRDVVWQFTSGLRQWSRTRRPGGGER